MSRSYKIQDAIYSIKRENTQSLSQYEDLLRSLDTEKLEIKFGALKGMFYTEIHRDDNNLITPINET